MRGEVWWADADGLKPVVLLSGDRQGEIRAIFVVEPSHTNIEGVCVELPIGQDEGLPDPGAVRVALPRKGVIPCNWLVTLGGMDLVRPAGVLSARKLQELTRMMELAELE